MLFIQRAAAAQSVCFCLLFDALDLKAKQLDLELELYMAAFL